MTLEHEVFKVLAIYNTPINFFKPIEIEELKIKIWAVKLEYTPLSQCLLIKTCEEQWVKVVLGLGEVNANEKIILKQLYYRLKVRHAKVS